MTREAHHLMQPILLILTASLLLTGCSKKPSASVNQTVDVATNPAGAQNAGSPTNASPSAAPVDMTQTINQYGTRAAYFDKITQFPVWKTVPRGAQVFDNVPIQIDGMICLWGSENTRINIVFPEQVLGIPWNQKFETLYVYHATFYRAPDQTPVYDLVFRYADGSSVTNEIKFGVDVVDWYANTSQSMTAPPSSPNAKIAWTGGSFLPDGLQPLRFCLTALDNPHPSLKVTTIDLYSCKNQPAACIMAMTAGQSGLLK